jgi:hypothetical protein
VISGLSKKKIRTTLIYLPPQMSDSAFNIQKGQRQINRKPNLGQGGTEPDIRQG